MNLNSKIFKKGKSTYEGSGIKNSNYGSKIKQSTGKKSVDEESWIGGTQKSQLRPQKVEESKISEKNSQPNPFQLLMGGSATKSVSSPQRGQAQKAPAQLIQDILKGLTNNTFTEVNPYYSHESEEKLAEILTNKNKLNSYVSQLENEMFQADSGVVKNYEILIILLKQLGNSDVEVKRSGKGIEIGFNKGPINRQQNQIEKLEKNLKEKDEQVKQIVEEYEEVIRNFNDVIEKLLEEKQGASNFGKMMSFK